MVSGIVGIDIGGTKIAGGLASLDGKITLWQSLPVEAEKGSEAVSEKLTSLISSLLKAKEGIKVISIGVACAGLIDTANGMVIASPNLPWREYPLKEKLASFNLPVYLINDADAAALGEYHFGAGRGVRNLVYITVSTGIGGGLILDGRLYTGLGVAGEVGHMTIQSDGPLCNCGNYGCWEALASGTAISRMAKERWGREVTAKQVYQEALGGDREAAEVIRLAGKYFGIGLANLVNIFGPELIVIGGGVSKMGEMFLAPAVEEMRRRSYPFLAGKVRWSLSLLGERAAIYGLISIIKS